MKLFKCDAQMTLTIIELPRPAWRVLPPKRWQVALMVAGIVVVSLVWALG